MSQKISGRVIRILSDTELMINLGSENDVRYGEKFEIYEPGEEIIDPESNDSLGTFDYIKATVEITKLFPKFSIVQYVTISEETRTTGGLSAFGNRTKTVTVTKVHPLNVNKEQINSQKVKNPNISINDLVRSI